MNTQNQQTYFDRITQSSLSHRACQISQTSLLEILPDIISLVHSKSQSAILSDAGRYDLVGKLKGLLTTMTERKLDVTMEDWSLEARGEKKEKRIVNFKRTNASPEGLHSVFVLPVYEDISGNLCTTVQHQLRPHTGLTAHLEIPAGKFDEGDESTEATAARELLEETGLVWDFENNPAIARGGQHDRDGGLTNAKGEALVVPVNKDHSLMAALSEASSSSEVILCEADATRDEQAQGLGQIYDFPIDMIPEYVDHCLSKGLGVTGTISNIAVGMRLQRYVAAHQVKEAALDERV